MKTITKAPVRNGTPKDANDAGNIFLKIMSIVLAMIFLTISLGILITLPGYIGGENGKYAIATMVISFLATIILIAPYSDE